MQSFIARQPILDRKRELFGYELLFRSSAENYFTEPDGDGASASLVSDCALLHGLDRLLSDHHGFINVTRRVLVEGLFTILPAQSTVIEILESIEPDDEVLEACRTLREAGYRLALDDFLLDSRLEAFLPEIDLLKVDFAATTPKQRNEFARRSGSPDVSLIAEKVESYDEFDEALDLGYSYFQGYFFCRPQMIHTARIPSQKMTYLRLLQQINEPDVDLARLERIVGQDVGITYKLLRYLNSAAFGFRNEIRSLRHAMAMLGLDAMKKWASLIALTILGNDKPHELIRVSLTRAKFCELLGCEANLQDRAFELFLLGMFSVLDAMMDQPIDETLAGLAVHEDVQATLLQQQTQLSPVYWLALALERGHWDELSELAMRLDTSESTIMAAYLDALEWSGSACRTEQSTGSARRAS